MSNSFTSCLRASATHPFPWYCLREAKRGATREFGGSGPARSQIFAAGDAGRGGDGGGARLYILPVDTSSLLFWFRPMCWFGDMPMGIESPGLASCAWRWVEVRWLLVMLLWMELVASGGIPSTSSPIKLEFAGLFRIWQFVASPTSPAGHGGEGSRVGLAKTCRSGSGQGKMLQPGDLHMVAFGATMICGRQSGLSMVPLRRHLFNLLWRPYTSRSALAHHFSSFPSGRFPGDGGEGRRRGLHSFSGGGRRPGLDCVFCFYFRVFYVNSEGHVVLFFLPEVLYVIPTVF